MFLNYNIIVIKIILYYNIIRGHFFLLESKDYKIIKILWIN